MSPTDCIVHRSTQVERDVKPRHVQVRCKPGMCRSGPGAASARHVSSGSPTNLLTYLLTYLPTYLPSRVLWITTSDLTIATPPPHAVATPAASPLPQPTPHLVQSVSQSDSYSLDSLTFSYLLLLALTCSYLLLLALTRWTLLLSQLTLSTLESSPRSAMRMSSSKSLTPVSARARPRNVAPPHAVPPLRARVVSIHRALG